MSRTTCSVHLVGGSPLDFVLRNAHTPAHTPCAAPGAVAKFVVPVVDDVIQVLITDELTKVMGPNATNELVQATQQYVNEVLENTTITSEMKLIDAAAIDGITYLLNRVLKPFLKSPIPAPKDPTATNVVWRAQFGRTFTYKLPEVKWGMGSHGSTLLSSTGEIDAEIQFEWGLAVDLQYTRHHGIRFMYGSATPVGLGSHVAQTAASGGTPPCFFADASLTFEAGTELSGDLLYLAAVLKPQGGLHATLVVHPPAVDSTGKRVHGSKYHLDADVDVKLSGHMTAGLAATADSVDMALPNVETDISFNWDAWKLHHQETTPTMCVLCALCCARSLRRCVLTTGNPLYRHFSHVQLCAGGFLVKTLGGVLKQIDNIKVVNALKKVTSVLNKPCPASDFFLGHTATIAEVMQIVEKQWCHGGCEFEGVFEFLDIMEDIEGVMTGIDELSKALDSGTDGCGIGKTLYDFYVDMTEKHPKVHRVDSGASHADVLDASSTPKFSCYTGDSWGPPGSFHCKDGEWKKKFVDPKSGELTKSGHFLGATVNFAEEGHFGYALPWLKDPEVAVLEMLLGISFPVVEVWTPGAEIGITGSGWEFIVWAWPEVVLHVDWDAGISIAPFNMSLTSTALVDTLKTGNAMNLLESVRIQTKDANGKPRWMLTGHVGIGATLDVGIWIFAIQASFWVTLVAKFSVQNPSGASYVTLGELFWQQTYDGGKGIVVLIKLELLGTFTISIVACIPIPWGNWCWTIVGWGDTFPLWGTTISSGVIGAPATTGGDVALSHVPAGARVQSFDRVDGSTAINIDRRASAAVTPSYVSQMARQRVYADGLTSVAHSGSFAAPTATTEAPRTWVIKHTKSQVVVPPSSAAQPVNVEVHPLSYTFNPKTGMRDASAPTHYGQHIVAPTAMTTVTTSCAALVSKGATPQTHSILSGGMCGPTHIAGVGNVTVTGVARDYQHPVTIHNHTRVLEVSTGLWPRTRAVLSSKLTLACWHCAGKRARHCLHYHWRRYCCGWRTDGAHASQREPDEGVRPPSSRHHVLGAILHAPSIQAEGVRWHRQRWVRGWAAGRHARCH